MTTDLHASTPAIFTRNRQGTPLAAELDVRLKSDEPLANVVDWWRTAYREWREPQLSAGNAAPLSFTENESVVNETFRSELFDFPCARGLK
jgi:hypothetical protein